ncbi:MULTISPECIES: hypothetical protein [Acinetobacter]|uniref:hypothetical protein n=1 Tax=Acinetobacter TaxID=469 RepID=UPI0020764FBD|nr:MULTISPECIES: hypothetical protein [Acinetobacter]MCU4441534.1 hypothetical protein [Acinetobacter pittii]
MTDNDQKPQKTSERLLRHILEYDPKKVDLKFIFDHVRNYGIAATVMLLGIYLAKHPETSITLIPSFDILWAVLLICIGFLLNILNLVQAILILAKLKLNIIIYFIFSFLLFFITSKLFFTSIRQVLGY